MRIIGKSVLGLDGNVQLVATDDGELGSKVLYEEMPLRAFRRTVQLMTAVLLVYGTEQISGDAEHLKRWDQVECLNYPRGSAWPASYEHFEDQVRPFIASANPNARGKGAYLDLLREDVDAYIVRELARLLHMGSYRWLTWGVGGTFPDLGLLMDQTTFVRALRGLQPFFRAAARRGDCYDTSVPMQVYAGKYLAKVLKAVTPQVEDKGFAAELEHLQRWAGYLRNLDCNRLEANVIYES